MNQTQNPTNYLFKTCSTESDLEKFKDNFPWWSEATQQENRLMPKTPEDLKMSLFTIFVYTEEGELVGAAGLFPCVDKLTGEYIYLNDRLLAETGSVFIVFEHREKGNGGTCVGMRLDYCEENNITPFMITQDIVMTDKVLDKSNLKKINLDDYEHFTEVCLRIKCTCRKINESNGNFALCDNCHLHKKSRVGFKRFEQHY
ncbi:MAG: hypothetical protein AAB895_01775 [Patescibacteria group bacterium]